MLEDVCKCKVQGGSNFAAGNKDDPNPNKDDHILKVVSLFKQMKGHLFSLSEAWNTGIYSS